SAIAVDPENPKRLYAGANGAVYVTDDGGVTWLRVLRIRGSNSGRHGAEAEDTDKTIEDEVADRVDDERDDLLEELKQQITDDLVAELGSYGEVLAEELAEELAEQQLADQEDELADEVRDELSLQAPSGPKSDEEIALGASAQQV